MAEWLYEAGIGEARAALVDDGIIIEAHVEPDDAAPRVGAIVAARLIAREGRRGTVRLIDSDLEGLVEPVDPAVTIGATLAAEVVRETIREPGARKRMKLRAVADGQIAPGPDLHARVVATGHPVRTIGPHEHDAFEAAGWSETLEEAAFGHIDFAGGALRISLTPAMTLIDVDGPGPPLDLATAGAKAAAAAVRRFDIAGSIGIDLPTVAGKTERASIAGVIDDILPQPFERTAVNGFGFIQIVRPRLRPSLCERLRFDAAGAQARALLRRAERCGLTGAVTLSAAPSVVAVLGSNPDWLETLARRLGGAVALHGDASLPMSGGHVALTR